MSILDLIRAHPDVSVPVTAAAVVLAVAVRVFTYRHPDNREETP